MFIYSKLRGTKVYHAETCGYCKNIKKENIGYFHSREEAQNNHYQKWRFTSLLDTIKSVADHQISIMDKDNLPSCVKHYLFSKYMRKSPKGGKRKAKEAREQKKFNKRVAIRSVLDLIDQLHCSSNSDVNGNYDSAYST